MRTWFRIFFIGGVIAYRGLFNWIAPAYYIPTMLLGPIFQILFFSYLGRYSRLGDDTFFVRVTGGDVETKETLRFDVEKKTVEIANRARGQR